MISNKDAEKCISDSELYASQIDTEWMLMRKLADEFELLYSYIHDAIIIVIVVASSYSV